MRRPSGGGNSIPGEAVAPDDGGEGLENPARTVKLRDGPLNSPASPSGHVHFWSSILRHRDVLHAEDDDIRVAHNDHVTELLPVRLLPGIHVRPERQKGLAAQVVDELFSRIHLAYLSSRATLRRIPPEGIAEREHLHPEAPNRWPHRGITKHTPSAIWFHLGFWDTVAGPQTAT